MRLGRAAILACAWLLALAGPASAATFTVTSSADSGSGSLRKAITDANANGQNDTIVIYVLGTATVQLQSALPTLENDASGADLTIDGPGSGIYSVRRNGGGDYRIFTVETDAGVSIDGMSVSNGSTPVSGGGISSSGDLTLTDVTVTANSVVNTDSAASGTSYARGGGIANGSGILTLIDSVVSDNVVSSANGSARGGGISGSHRDGDVIIERSVVRDNSVTGAPVYDNLLSASGGGMAVYDATITDSTIASNSVTGSGGDPALGGGIKVGLDSNFISSQTSVLTIENSTISANTVSGLNSAASGGGITSGPVSTDIALENSTVSGNSVSSTAGSCCSTGGGLFVRGNLSLTSVTVTDNGTQFGGSGENLYVPATTTAVITAENTIVSDPRTGNASCGPGTITSQGHNLEDGDSCGFDRVSDLTGADPQLGPLADNEGETETHALAQTSPALDWGDNPVSGPAVDQRGAGFARTVDFSGAPNNPAGGDGTDIGAFELQPPPGGFDPTAVDDAATVAEDSGETRIDLVGNDTDPDGGAKEIASVDRPENGKVKITDDRTGVLYAPDADYCNDPGAEPTDDFTYTLAPGGSSATVAVTVTCVDDAPTAVDDTATVAEDSGETEIDLVENDTDPDGGAKSIASVGGPDNGTVEITDDRTGVVYEPDADYCNDPGAEPTDDFTYTLAPGGSSATVAVTVTCTPPPAQCADGADNDGDGKIDFGVDPGCDSAGDDDETDPPPPGDASGGGGADSGSGDGGDTTTTPAADGTSEVVDGVDGRVRPILARPGVNARQARRGRARRVVKVVVTGRLVKTQGRRCSGRVAVGLRMGGKKVRRTFQIQKSGKAPCTYRTVFRVKVRKLKKAVRPRRKRLLVRVNTNYKGSRLLAQDRAPSVLKRAIR